MPPDHSCTAFYSYSRLRPLSHPKHTRNQALQLVITCLAGLSGLLLLPCHTIAVAPVHHHLYLQHVFSIHLCPHLIFSPFCSFQQFHILKDQLHCVTRTCSPPPGLAPATSQGAAGSGLRCVIRHAQSTSFYRNSEGNIVATARPCSHCVCCTQTQDPRHKCTESEGGNFLPNSNRCCSCPCPDHEPKAMAEDLNTRECSVVTVLLLIMITLLVWNFSLDACGPLD